MRIRGDQFLEKCRRVRESRVYRYIVGNHGALAWKDAHAWKLFMRSCAGLVLMLSLTGPHGLEKQICHLSGSIVYHAVVDHACIVCLFGGVAKNAVHLTNLAAAKMATL